MSLIDFVLLLFAAKTLVFVYGAARSRRILLPSHSVLNETVSIVIPARNEQEALPSCLESLLKNTDPTIEFIIVNDRSNDATQEIIDAFSAKDSRIKSVQLTEERFGNLRGKPGALHAGISTNNSACIFKSYNRNDCRIHYYKHNYCISSFAGYGMDDESYIGICSYVARTSTWVFW
jgi:glycosyltransferase involved in cell wall biosynthesis